MPQQNLPPPCIAHQHTHFSLYVKTKLRQDIWKFGEEIYLNSSTGIMTKTHCRNLNDIDLIWKYTRPGFELSQILTGHGYHRAYLHRFKISDTDVCLCDNTTRHTMEHLIEECPRWNHTGLDLTPVCSNLKVNPFKIIDALRKESTMELHIFETY